MKKMTDYEMGKDGSIGGKAWSDAARRAALEARRRRGYGLTHEEHDARNHISLRAHELSAHANNLESGLNMAGPDKFREAMQAHNDAANAHHRAAELHSSYGNQSTANEHRRLANEHIEKREGLSVWVASKPTVSFRR